MKADDHSFAQMEMEEQDKADNLEPIEISEIEGAGALENEEELTDNESDGTDDVRGLFLTKLLAQDCYSFLV